VAITSKQIGSGLYAALYFVCSFFPTIGYKLAPGGDVADKKTAFYQIYFTTLPLSLAATTVFLIWFCKWLDTDQERLWWTAGLIVTSAVFGIGFGSSLSDQQALAQLHGPPLAVVFELVALALFAYAKFYGWALFTAGVLSSVFAAAWLKEKLDAISS
jgi:hypothetical protein